MTNTITRLQTLIRLAEMQTDRLPIVALQDEDLQALKICVALLEKEQLKYNGLARIRHYLKEGDNLDKIY